MQFPAPLLTVVSSLLGITVAALVDSAFEAPIRRWIDARVRRLKRVQRIRWPDDRPAFEESWHVFCHVHPDLRDGKSRLEAFLAEDATTETAEEFYLVARRKMKIRAVLYASTLKESNAHKHPRCFVWNLVSDPDLGADEALELGMKLWQALERWVEKTCDSGCGDFYIQTVGPEQEPEADEAEARRRRRLEDLLKILGARRVDFPYVMADTEDLDPEEEMAGVLYYLGTQTGPLPADTFLDDLYSFSFWDFIYGREFARFEDLKRRTDYFADLIVRMRVETGDQVALLAVDA